MFVSINERQVSPLHLSSSSERDSRMFTSLTRSQLLLERVDAAEFGSVKLTDQYRQLQAAFTQQQAQQEQDLAGLRETFTSQIAWLSETVEFQHSQQQSLAAHLDQLRDEVSASLALIGNQQQQLGQRLQTLETAISEQRQAIEHVAQLLSTHTDQQAAALLVQRTEIEALLAAHIHEGNDAPGAVHQNGAADHAVAILSSEQPVEKRPHRVTRKAPASQAANTRGKRHQGSTDDQQEYEAALLP
jgi:chromosome segregation ATPase